MLVGPMGSGKTTVGRALARRLGWRFEDLDETIERDQSTSITEIFEERGERAFRELERRATLAALERQAPAVVALGGGAFESPEVRSRCDEADITTVFLDTSPETSDRRLAHATDRPLLQRDNSLARLAELYAARIKQYRTADIVIDTDDRSADEILELICDRLA